MYFVYFRASKLSRTNLALSCTNGISLLCVESASCPESLMMWNFQSGTSAKTNPAKPVALSNLDLWAFVAVMQSSPIPGHCCRLPAKPQVCQGGSIQVQAVSGCSPARLAPWGWSCSCEAWLYFTVASALSDWRAHAPLMQITSSLIFFNLVWHENVMCDLQAVRKTSYLEYLY